MIVPITLYILLSCAQAQAKPQQFHHLDQSQPIFHGPPRFLQPAMAPQIINDFVDQSQGFINSQLANGRPSYESAARVLANHFQFTDSGYQYAYETENGIQAQHIAERNGPSFTTQGFYSYPGDDGQVYTVNYIADENGFRAVGSHLPTPPPIPEAILKSLELNARDEAAGIFDDGSYSHPGQHNEVLDQVSSSNKDVRQMSDQPNKYSDDQQSYHDNLKSEGLQDNESYSREPMFKENDKIIDMEKGLDKPNSFKGDAVAK